MMILFRTTVPQGNPILNMLRFGFLVRGTTTATTPIQGPRIFIFW